MSTVIVIATIVIAVALVGWFIFNRKNPARSDRVDRPPLVTDSDRFYATSDRPAGPDAEPMNPDLRTSDRQAGS